MLDFFTQWFYGKLVTIARDQGRVKETAFVRAALLFLSGDHRAIVPLTGSRQASSYRHVFIFILFLFHFTSSNVLII